MRIRHQLFAATCHIVTVKYNRSQRTSHISALEMVGHYVNLSSAHVMVQRLPVDIIKLDWGDAVPMLRFDVLTDNSLKRHVV